MTSTMSEFLWTIAYLTLAIVFFLLLFGSLMWLVDFMEQRPRRIRKKVNK